LDSLRLLGMELDLLCLKVADQFPGSIDRDLIIDREQNPPVSIERLVDFRALFTHGCRPVAGGCDVAPARRTTISAAFCFNGTAAIRFGRIVAGRLSSDLTGRGRSSLDRLTPAAERAVHPDDLEIEKRGESDPKQIGQQEPDGRGGKWC
jgi:hypothetical protein